jgi:hypothetical protein
MRVIRGRKTVNELLLWREWDQNLKKLDGSWSYGLVKNFDCRFELI